MDIRTEILTGNVFCRLRRVFLLAVVMSLCSLSFAQSVKLLVSPSVEEGARFQLTISAENVEVSPPDKVAIPNCTLNFGPGVSTRSTFQSSGGKMYGKTVVEYTYTFTANKASTVTIPAFSLAGRDGKSFSTKPTKLTITPRGQRPAAHARTDEYEDAADGQRINPSEHIASDDMFVRIIVDNNNVYEQEPVVATIKLYTHQDIRTFQMTKQPTFEGFLSEELDGNYPVTHETHNGKEYATVVLKRCVLYPQKTGKLKLTSGTYDVTLVDRVRVNSGMFIPDYRLVERQIKTPDNTATINVMPLPEPKPAGFDGAVGSFTAENSISTLTPRTNEPVTYTYKISGTGNIKYLKTPSLDIPDGFDTYTPKTDIDAHFSGGDITGSYTASFTIVPQEVGTFEIPPVVFSYFNPKTRSYHTIDLKGFKLAVSKGEGSAASEGKGVVRRGMTDILHIKDISGQLSGDVSYVYRQGWYWCLYILLAAALATAIAVYRRQIRLNADVRGRRLAKALRKAMKRFRKARALMASHSSEAFYAEINKALWGYLSDKLGIPASQLVRENISAQLEGYGLGLPAVEDVISILDECEMARFTPNSDADMAVLYDKVMGAVRNIENVK